jgi:putative hydrolases of HD superfamily
MEDVMPADKLSGLLAFLYEVGHLKRLPRQGWLIAGVRNPESVAEHSFRVGVLAYIIAALEGADADRAAALGLFHDVPESRVGDIPSVGRQYLSSVPAEQVVKDQTADLPAALAEHIQQLIGEFEDKTTLEARCAKDADKLDCLLQAREYESEGYQQVGPWITTMAAAVRTNIGKQLAELAQRVTPRAWWDSVVSNYRMMDR